MVRCEAEMEVRPITEQNIWEDFVLNYHPNFLLQSWAWGKFAQKQGRQVFRLGLRQDQRLIGAALFTKVTSKRANYLECQGGPLLDWDRPEVFSELLRYLKELAHAEAVDFLRIRPPLFYSQSWRQFFRNQGFWLAPMYFPAEHTLLLDLTQSEEDLLSRMRKNTRYGIRRADREGVKVQRFSHRENSDELGTALNSFFELYQTTVKRQKFTPYNYQYFNNEVEAFTTDNRVTIFLARWNKPVVSGAIVLFYGDFAYYHHAASLPTNPDVYAPHRVIWEVIKEAKRRGCKQLDLWGVAPKEASAKHPRSRLTFFKEGYGGKRVRWMHTLDLPIQWYRWPIFGYGPLYLFVKMERWKEGL